jgi:hypothetical protein
MEVTDSFNFLIGTWAFDRLITDHRTGIQGSCVGIASLTETKLELSDGTYRCGNYYESGELRLERQVVPTRRRLSYSRQKNLSVNLFFLDGRFFTDLDLRTGSWRAIHQCGEDYYEITTTITSDDEVHEHWQATGPRKDYVAVTTLRRQNK